MKLVQLSLCLAIGLAGSAASAQDRESRRFLDQALKGDNSEMMLGELAARRGVGPALRAYGRTLRDDHARARAQVVPLARRAGVAISREAMPEALQERRKLERLSGRAFDREFARYMVEDHRKDVAEFEDQARKGGAAGDLAKRTLPVLRKHLATAERLSRG